MRLHSAKFDLLLYIPVNIYVIIGMLPPFLIIQCTKCSKFVTRLSCLMVLIQKLT